MREFQDIAFTARPEDKNAADMWVALSFLADWDFGGPDGAPRGRCSASLARLAALARVCPRTARKGLKNLSALGLVRAERIMSGGRILVTRYTLLPWGRASGKAA